MKRILLVLGCLGTMSALAADVGGDAFDRSTATLAARLLLDRVRGEVFAPTPDPEPLLAAMTNEPAAYASAVVARAALRPRYAETLTNRYARAAEAVLARLSDGRPVEEAFGTEFATNAVASDPAAVEAAVARDYDAAFGAARSRAVESQRALFVSKIRPGETEFEETDRETLRKRLVDRIAEEQPVAVFEENRSYLSAAFAEPLLAQAETQRNAQRALLDAAVAEGWTPPVLEDSLRQALDSFVAESRRGHEASGEPAYGAFPSVLASIPEKALARAEDRLSRVAGETPVGEPDDAIRETLEGDPFHHRFRAYSFCVFRPAWREALARDVLARAEALAPESEKDALKDWAEPRLRGDTATARVLDARVERSLEERVGAIRDGLAQAQAQELYPTLLDRTWFPSGVCVDAFAEEPDWDGAVRGWRNAKTFADFAETALSRDLLEETDAILDAGVVRALDLGRRARTRQHGIVDDQFLAVRAEFATAEKKPVLEEIVKRYTERVETAWDEERPGVLWLGVPETDLPPNAAVQHAELFPSTRERIELKSRMIVESLEEEREKKEEKKEETEEKPEDKPEPMPEIVELECVFELERDGDDIVIRCNADGELLAQGRCVATPKRFRSEAATTASLVTSQLGDKLRAMKAAGAEQVNVTTSLLIRDPFVYYGMVAALSRALQERVKDLEEDGISLSVGGNSGE